MMHFPSPIASKSVILVEDIVSANRMNPFYPCVALLGVHLNEEKLQLLAKIGIKHVIIALDNDATRQAIKICRKWLFNVSILPLQRDLKDESENRLREIAAQLTARA